ncbi:MAG: hypothetical protein LBC75_09595 [Fibromonadaceae bacterium]|nr:hypothetical protein [Fibromonadaceae bacterium]
MKTENIIYHYCSLEAFHSIITTKSFWLFSLDSSNAESSLSYHVKILRKRLRRRKYRSI